MLLKYISGFLKIVAKLVVFLGILVGFAPLLSDGLSLRSLAGLVIFPLVSVIPALMFYLPAKFIDIVLLKESPQ